MLRERFNEALKGAMKAKDTATVSTVRMILAGLKDRDIAARGKGNAEGISDTEIQQMLQSMVKQRREAMTLYEQGGRQELVEKERGEIAIIEGFLPQQLDAAASEQAIRETIASVGAASVKDMGRVMTALRERYAGQMDFGLASATVKRLLG
ncbi:MAG TPA: GatB/YqeY domain-containing protein [Stellaceae bacterium]|jgi:uncharacterized protein YqeY